MKSDSCGWLCLFILQASLVPTEPAIQVYCFWVEKCLTGKDAETDRAVTELQPKLCFPKGKKELLSQSPIPIRGAGTQFRLCSNPECFVSCKNDLAGCDVTVTSPRSHATRVK